jgi:hypothetical protein
MWWLAYIESNNVKKCNAYFPQKITHLTNNATRQYIVYTLRTMLHLSWVELYTITRDHTYNYEKMLKCASIIMYILVRTQGLPKSITVRRRIFNEHSIPSWF